MGVECISIKYSNASSNYSFLINVFFLLFFQIVEGYGQTECTAPITLTVQGDHVPEHVGPPIACNHVKVNILYLFSF